MVVLPIKVYNDNVVMGWGLLELNQSSTESPVSQTKRQGQRGGDVQGRAGFEGKGGLGMLH